MRLNGKRIVEVMEEKSLTEETICSRTGLYQKSFQWIVKEGFASEDAAERIADAVGLTVGEILLPEITGNVEKVIEFIKDSERAAVTFCQGRYKSRIKKLAAERPEECEIVAENQDGSLCAHIPVAWIKINPTQHWNIHCCPCKFVLYNLQGKKVAATIRSSDGLPLHKQR